MTKIVPLVLLMLIGISCKKDKKKDTPSPDAVVGTLTGQQVSGIVEAEYLGCGPGWSVILQDNPRLTVIVLNLPQKYKVANKRIYFKVGSRIAKDCEVYSSYRGERYEVKSVWD